MGKGLAAAGVVIVALAAMAVFVLRKVDETNWACTQIGCGSSVAVAFPASERNRAEVIKVCVDSRCVDGHGRGAARVYVRPRQPGPGLVNIVVVVQPRKGKAIVAGRRVTLRKHEPNGAGCEPTCWAGPPLVYRNGAIIRGTFRADPRRVDFVGELG